MSETYFFIVKESENTMEILEGFAKYNEAHTRFIDITDHWKGSDSTFRIISAPIVKSVTIIGGDFA
jgi:hypothetical protein